MSFWRLTRAGLVSLALAAGGLLLAAGPAAADTGDTQGGDAGGAESAPGELAPAGVPVLGLVQSALGATKVLPGPGH